MSKQEKDKGQSEAQRDDTSREEQRSHGSHQNRSKKEGHPTQVGTGRDQQTRPKGNAGHRP